ncbi:MAG: DotI/IcmL/TraM family protein [Enterobacterales bacterium]|nr:DotI/IcmL/TraM family protein [Enterobacterales bacterium]
MPALRKYIPIYMVQLSHFYLQVAKKANKAVLLSFVLLLSLLLLILVMTSLASTRLLAPIHANGMPLNENPELALYSKSEVLHWNSLAVSHLFDLSYREQKRYFNELKYDYLTDKGFREFYIALQQIDMIQWLATKGHASIFIPINQKMIRHGVSSSGIYKWRIQVNGTLVLLNEGKTSQLPYQLTIDVLRVSQLAHEEAIRIDRVIAEKRNSA